MILPCTILITRMCNYVTDMNIYQISANKNNLHNLQMSIRVSSALRLGLFWLALQRIKKTAHAANKRKDWA